MVLRTKTLSNALVADRSDFFAGQYRSRPRAKFYLIYDEISTFEGTASKKRCLICIVIAEKSGSDQGESGNLVDDADEDDVTFENR